MSKVILKNVNKYYENGFHAAKNINLDIKDKEFIVLVGPSGCGKSTTLRMIAGLEDISEGKLYIGDKLMNDVLPKDRDIAMVFQNYALYPHMTVYDNMAFSLKLRKTPQNKIEEKVRKAAKTLQIENLLDRKPKELSGGQRQRVALGRAIVREPNVFLMDEPLSNLDAKLRAEMRTEIINLHKQLDTTFIYVTHDQIEAMTMGDRIVVMKDGIIHQVDTPLNLYNNPINKFIASFIGSPEMNMVDAKVEKNKEDILLALKGSNIKITLPGAKGKILENKGYIGKMVTLGIRAEDIHDESSFIELSPETTFTAHISFKELLGAEVLFHFYIGERKLVSKLNSRAMANSSDHLKLAMDGNKINVFDINTEKNIFYTTK